MEAPPGCPGLGRRVLRKEVKPPHPSGPLPVLPVQRGLSQTGNNTPVPPPSLGT